MSAPRKRKPGKPVPDAQRRTTRVTVHLPPDAPPAAPVMASAVAES